MALTNDTKPGRRGLPLGKLLLSGLAGFALALGFGGKVYSPAHDECNLEEIIHGQHC